MNFFSSLEWQRLFFVILFFVIILNKLYFLIFYEIIFYSLFEFLNWNKNYLKLNSFQLYNWLFIGFLVFIIFVRADGLSSNEIINNQLNMVEHFFFSGIICLLIAIFFQLFNWFPNRLMLKSFLVFCIFNFIGLINEFFQNYCQQLELFEIKVNNWKDLKVNAIGSILYLFFALVFKFKKKKVIQ